MSKTTEALRAVGFVNDWDLTSNGGPMIHYHPYQHRSPTGHGWHVGLKGKTIKGGAWYEHGGRTFTVIVGGPFDVAGRKALRKAHALVIKYHPQAVMVRSPFDRHGFVDKKDLDAALKKAGVKYRTKEISEYL